MLDFAEWSGGLELSDYSMNTVIKCCVDYCRVDWYSGMLLRLTRQELAPQTWAANLNSKELNHFAELEKIFF